jgi:hypothetical protein
MIRVISGTILLLNLAGCHEGRVSNNTSSFSSHLDQEVDTGGGGIGGGNGTGGRGHLESGGLIDQSVSAVVRAQVPEIDRCLAGLVTGIPPETIHVACKVNEDGTTSIVRIFASHEVSEASKTCIRRAVDAMVFRSWDSDDREFVFSVRPPRSPSSSLSGSQDGGR